jgi:hypothetical protein
MKVMVTTVLRQELEVPEGWEKEHVLDFLAEYQSFRGAFQGVSNLDETARILDLVVVDEEIAELSEGPY